MNHRSPSLDGNLKATSRSADDFAPPPFEPEIVELLADAGRLRNKIQVLHDEAVALRERAARVNSLHFERTQIMNRMHARAYAERLASALLSAHSNAVEAIEPPTPAATAPWSRNPPPPLTQSAGTAREGRVQV